MFSLVKKMDLVNQVQILNETVCIWFWRSLVSISSSSNYESIVEQIGLLAGVWQSVWGKEILNLNLLHSYQKVFMHTYIYACVWIYMFLEEYMGISSLSR